MPGEGEYPSFSTLNDLIDHYRDEGLSCKTGVQIKLLKVSGLSPFTLLINRFVLEMIFHVVQVIADCRMSVCAYAVYA